jgi:hypothetical protein
MTKLFKRTKAATLLFLADASAWDVRQIRSCPDCKWHENGGDGAVVDDRVSGKRKLSEVAA